MKINIALLIFCCIRLSLHGQDKDCSYSIRGQVIDSSHTHPLELAEIEIIGLKGKQALTGKNGEFIISGLCAGQTEIHISHRQCEHMHLFIHLHRDTQFTIYLQHIEEFEGARIAVKKEPGESINSLNAAQLESRKGSSIATMMQDLGGVSLLKTGGSISKPVVNGLHGNRVIIVNNGIRQEGQNWGMEHAPEIDAFLASGIELIRGAEGLRYAADAIGGVIMVEPVSIFREKAGVLLGELNMVAATNGRSGIISGLAGNKISNHFPLYWRLQGTFKQSGNIRSPEYFIANTGLKEHNFSSHLGYRAGKLRTEAFYSSFNTRIGIFSGSHIGNLDDLDKAIHSDRPVVDAGFTYSINRPYQQVRHQLVKLKNDYEVNGRNHIELILSYQNNHREEYDVLRSASASQVPSFDYYIRTYMGDLAWIRTDFHSVNIRAGATAMHQSNAYTGRFFIPGFYQRALASYFTASRVFKRMRYEAGVRYDIRQLEVFLWPNKQLQTRVFNFHDLTYLLLAELSLDQRSKLSLVHASAWRPPAPNELYANGLHQGLASIEIGDSSLKPERSFNQSLSYSRQQKTYSIEAEAYYKYISGYINLVPALPPQLTVRGAFPVFRYVQCNAAIYGFNLLAKRELGRHFFIKTSANILYGDNLSDRKALSQMPPLSGKTYIGYDHKKIFFQAYAQYAARQHRYADGTDYLAPPPAYCIAGIDAMFRFNLKKWPLKLNISISNLGNTRYREYLNRFRYFTDEQGFNLTIRIIIPLDIQLKTQQ